MQPTATSKPVNAIFSVDTLVGGTGAEDVDGPVIMAQISRLDSIALDKNDNVYFLNAEKSKVRKFNAGNGTVETLSIADHSLDNRYSINQPHTYFQSLKFNSASNKLYLGATIAGTHYITFYEISPTVQSVTYAPANGTYYSFVQFTDDNNLFLGYNSYYDDSIIGQATLGKEVSVIAKASDKTGFSFGPFSYYSWQRVDAIVNANTIYVFDTYISTITKLQVFPRKIEVVKEFDTLAFDCVVAYNNRFYATRGATIYEIGVDGSISVFVDGSHLTYNDGNPIKRINQLAFDSQGNVILYDDQNKAIRRINL